MTENNDKDKTVNSGNSGRGIVTSLIVVLSALGIMAIIIAAGFAFFYPEMGSPVKKAGLEISKQDQKDRETTGIVSPESENTGSSENTETGDSGTESGESGDSAASVLEKNGIELDDSEALIDDLMSEGNNDGGKTDDAVDISINSGNNRSTTGSTSTSDSEDTAPDRSSTPATPESSTGSSSTQASYAPPEYKEVTKDIYWIQAGSFPNSVKAEELSQLLNSRGINTNIQTRRVNGTLYYRVRIGAFSTRNEAENFNSMVIEQPEIGETLIYKSWVTEKVKVQ